MKYYASFISISGLILILFTMAVAGDAVDVKERVDSLIHKHYWDGIPYTKAHELGSKALPLLIELLNNPDEKEFWVNIIVTIGFIEDPIAIDTLKAFIENSRGEVDSFTFRALLSIPYALGCIAGGGDTSLLRYLTDNIQFSRNQPVQWSYRNKPISELIAEQSVMGLAVSGRPEARKFLMRLKAENTKRPDQQASGLKDDNVNQGLTIMDRINSEGRAAVLNPHRKN